MDKTLITSIIFINLALVFYTLGVFGEFFKKKLHKNHLYFFYGGVICDTIGTSLMTVMAAESGGGSLFHSITGAMALIIMLCHAVWATIVIKKGNEKSLENFHKFSIVAWFIWLIPYISGMVMGMMG